MDSFNINGVDLGVQVAIAFQGTFFIFFVVSPILGYFLAQIIKKRTDFFIVISVSMSIVLGVNLGLNFLLRAILPPEAMSELAIGGLSMVASLAVAWLIGRYLRWFLADPEKPLWMIEHENMPAEEMMPFDKRRKEWQARKAKASRGK